MKLTFYPTVNNFTIDGEKLFMQFLLAAFALFFIYIACRSMIIVEENYKRTNKKITQLKTKLNIVLSQNAPVCENVLYRQVMRCRQSLVAGYLKDLMKEKEFEAKRYSSLYQNSQNKPTFGCTTVLPEKADTTELFPEEVSFTGRNVSDERNKPEEKLITQENLCRQESNTKDVEIKKCITINHPLESIIFKTLEGQTQRRTARSNIFEKIRTKIPKPKIPQGLYHENKVYPALNDAKPVLKVSSVKKPLLLKNPQDNYKVYTALTNTRSPFKSSYKKPPSQKINVSNWDQNTGNAKTCGKRPSDTSLIANVQKLQRNKNLIKESQKPAFENTNAPIALVQSSAEARSVCSYGFESDSEPEAYNEQFPRVVKNNKNNQQKSLLPTINEESSEETNSTD